MIWKIYSFLNENLNINIRRRRKRGGGGGGGLKIPKPGPTSCDEIIMRPGIGTCVITIIVRLSK